MKLITPPRVAALALVVGAVVYGQFAPGSSYVRGLALRDNPQAVEVARIEERRAVLYGLAAAALVFCVLYRPTGESP